MSKKRSRTLLFNSKNKLAAIGAVLIVALLILMPLLTASHNGDARRGVPVEAQSTPTDASASNLPTPSASDPNETRNRKWNEKEAQDACGAVYEGDSTNAEKCKTMLMNQPQ